MSSIYVLFICIVVPLVMMTLFVDNKSKIFIIYMCLGCVVCLISGEINAIFAAAYPDKSLFFITVNITPITEELLKAIPIMVYALFISDDKETLINISMVTGIGFAILENTYMLVNTADVTFCWALIRGFGAGFMHGLSTLLVGYGLSYVRKGRAVLISGVTGLLATAIIFHGTYNALVQSSAAYIGYCYPIVMVFIIKIIVCTIKKYAAKFSGQSKSDVADGTASA